MCADRRETEEILRGAQSVFERLLARGKKLTTAESCTGGMLAAFLTCVPGVSAVYPGGFVTYSAEQKEKMLGIPGASLAAWGIVSAETAKAMALGAAEKTGADAALSVTGNAGPDTLEGKPVGLVYIGYVYRGKAAVRECRFAGDRNEIRLQTARAAFALLLERMGEQI